jgi:hypothetical protein
MIGVGLYRLYSEFRRRSQNGSDKKKSGAAKFWGVAALVFFVAIFGTFAPGVA